MKKANRIALAFVLLCLPLAACQSTVRKGVYSAYEVVGVEKRDLLRNRVDDARDEQKEAGETFKDALEQLRAVYAFEGGNLEKKYDQMRASYEQAEGQAADVNESITRLETVANDLFKEWEGEIRDIKTASLRTSSRQSLAETRQRYGVLRTSLKRSEGRMKPVLEKFNDQVLYLKHNLNARAIDSLKGEANTIQKDIERLIAEMNASIEEADKFIAQLPK